jgi:uncharacterized protein
MLTDRSEHQVAFLIIQDAQIMLPESQTEQADLKPTVWDSELDGNAWASPSAQPGTEHEASAPKKAEPVKAGERFFAVDVLRGCALLGILAMNIVAFGWPMAAYSDPTRGGGFEGLDRGIWFFNHMFFEMKMMTIFSMLFGAGLVLMDQRAEARGAKIRGVYYRRILWLLAIGLVHAYLIWNGDILVMYAETGLLLYLFRNLKPKTLIILGVSASLLILPLFFGFVGAINYMRVTTARVEAQIKANEKPSNFDQKIHDIWDKNFKENFNPTPEKRAESWNKELAAYRGGYLGIVKFRAKDLLIEHTIGFLLGGFLLAGSRMLLGMGLMKLGVFSAQRSRKFYWWLLGIGYCVGLPLMVIDARQLIAHNFSIEYGLSGGFLVNVFGSVVVALGHVGLLMLIVQSGALSWLTQRLAAVGRMALSNYLTHSIVCTTLFYGYGFGLFGTINRTGLALIVLTIWIIQLVISPIWLKHFRFGPAEWVWRSLTYWRLQPMRSNADPSTAVLTAA